MSEWVSSGVAALAAGVRARPFAAIAASHLLTGAVYVWVASDGRPLRLLYKHLFRAVVSLAPASIVEAENAKAREKIERSVVGPMLDGNEQLYLELPGAGMTKDAVIALLDRYATSDEKHWRTGKVSGTVYHGGASINEVATAAFSRYSLSNPLHPATFPYLRKMESEVVSMVVSLFRGGPDACGTMTSGGTESILMACKAYRDLARKSRGVRDPELVVPVTAHAAFDKACAYFGITLVHVAVDPVTFRADPAAMARACTRNTIALVASAPCYAQGVVDPVPDIAAVALAKGLPLHVDCCLGSFCVAFAGAAGYPQPCAFDFSVPGVTSISVDTHKYGFTTKGSSVVAYATRALRRSQYFVAPEWTGGIYASPSIAGSRPGSLIAATWATLLHVGSDGYTAAVRTILAAAVSVADAVRALPESLVLCGEPTLSVVCFTAAPRGAKLVNIYHISDAMGERGWDLNILQNPTCLHLCVTFANAGRAADDFARDLREAVDEVRAAPPGKYKDGKGAIYGAAEAIPDKALVGEATHGFLDGLYRAKPFPKVV